MRSADRLVGQARYADHRRPQEADHQLQVGRTMTPSISQPAQAAET